MSRKRDETRDPLIRSTARLIRAIRVSGMSRADQEEAREARQSYTTALMRMKDGTPRDSHRRTMLNTLDEALGDLEAAYSDHLDKTEYHLRKPARDSLKRMSDYALRIDGPGNYPWQVKMTVAELGPQELQIGDLIAEMVEGTALDEEAALAAWQLLPPLCCCVIILTVAIYRVKAEWGLLAPLVPVEEGDIHTAE